MNFVADEGIDSRIVKELRENGHSVTYVAELEPGISDDTVLEWANREKALLITADKDFGELIFHQQRLSTGVILARLSGLSPLRKVSILLDVINQHSKELIEAFTVVTPSGARIRQRKP